MRILLIEDDRMIGEAILQALKDAAYAVDWVQDGRDAITAFLSEEYDLALLDLGLPNVEGLKVLKEIRAHGDELPVIIITARDGLEDRVAGLDNGADDYLVKPFEMRELLARMRANLRRKGANAGPLLTNGVVTLDPSSFEATHSSETVRLTAREFALLQALLARPGTILSRADLERNLYGWNEEVESNAVEFLIHAVRKKLGASVIRNVRGVGWMVDRPS
ncbi:MAG: response regulator transcription factor [Rhizobiales bacterium]|nr:response regulator transcription factor [Hyphomicrobiales bacterium]